ncbi:hypothetical protein Vau01_002750 [Virgisporangium aurantiacum]|uniref:HTH cro/C1-type domain-containing protein n=2 Tax=Virgisporangium aurantiacum TaxID=175570 RepID=A0A8J3YVN2_9ACTN|nr:hypothetical protein Vau01_002750 [Virgisporangium aurantiacum]
MTQAEVADLTGLSVRAISNIERNVHSRLRRDSLVRIARVLNLDEAQVAVLRGVRSRQAVGRWPGEPWPGEPVPSRPRPGDGETRVPAQLPMAVPDLVGRGRVSDEVVGALTAEPATGRVRGCPSVVVVNGAVGVGKTALAVHVGHRVRAKFPDGQLFLDLRGTADALAHAVFAVGPSDGHVPTDPVDRAALLRSYLSDRRVLVVIDGAATEAQVRSLLPGSSGCAVLVTSHRRLLGLEGARHIGVDPLDEQAAVDLIRRSAGRDPADLQPLARWCGFAPLALRAVGIRLAAHPDVSPSDLLALLATAPRPLDLLTAGDLAVRDRLAAAHDTLDGTTRRMFALLTTADPAALTPRAVAAATACTPEVARARLDAIADSGLLHRLTTPDGHRYRLDGPARAFAREAGVAAQTRPTRTA